MDNSLIMKKTESSESDLTKQPDTSKNANSPPNPEVQAKTPSRRFTAEYKLRILEEIDRCQSGTDRGAVIRREGLFSSSISEWRKARDSGALSALKRIPGRKSKHDAKDQKISALEDKINALNSRLTQAQAIIEVQKKVSEIFGCITPNNQNSGVSL